MSRTPSREPRCPTGTGRHWPAALLVLAASLAPALAAAQVRDGRLDLTSAKMTSLVGEWRFHWDCADDAVPPADDGQWRTMRVPLFWPTMDRPARRTGCYRLEFTVAEALHGHTLAVQFARVRYLYRLRLNGRLLGGSGTERADGGEPEVNHHSELCFVLPPDAMRPGENTLDLWVDDVGLDQGGTQGSGFAVGPLPAIAARRYVAKGLALAAGASLAALALYFGLAWARRRQATYAREFAAFMLLFGAPFLAAGLHALTWLRTPGGPCVWSAAPMPIETPPSFVVGSYWMVAVTLTLVRFFKHFFGLPSRWFYRGVHAVAGAELAALAVCGGFDFARLFNRYHFVFLLAVVFPYLAWRLGQATRQGDRRVKRLAVAAFAGIFTASLAAVLYSRQVVDVPLDLTIPACVLLFVAAVAWEARRRLRDEAVDEPTTPVRA